MHRGVGLDDYPDHATMEDYEIARLSLPKAKGEFVNDQEKEAAGLLNNPHGGYKIRCNMSLYWERELEDDDEIDPELEPMLVIIYISSMAPPSLTHRV